MWREEVKGREEERRPLLPVLDDIVEDMPRLGVGQEEETFILRVQETGCSESKEQHW